MKKIELNETPYVIPESWEECSPKLLKALLPLRLANLEALLPGQRIRLKWNAVLAMLEAPDTLTAQIDPEDRHRLAKLSSWIWQQSVVKKKPLDFFEFQGVTYHLPQPGFADTTAIEIAMANIQYIAFCRKENPNPKAIFQIISTLCRPVRKDLSEFKASPEWNGDEREEYNTVIAQERAKSFETGELPVGVVMAVLYYFEWMNGSFLKQYKDVYNEDDEDDEPLYKHGEGLVTTLMEVAKTGTFGDFDKVCKQNGHTVWIFLRDSNLKIKRANQRAERADE
ncbi:hypothetical protein [Siphonobacter sp. SORGH_AS_0500]|uniref:hypothetical protein n=1 Tax=Siphonobacter sp. SORGH_AS_0500 TaxID=1864824 RepID=UPI002861CAAF|nr:hypothetical protein [Siphonobacter sp. SORGH_AS_0500]MDR6195168.1 hypothetical protein [Siphonobacter sp. SORGH_AS_0500]